MLVPPSMLITPATGVAVPASPSRDVRAATPAASRLIELAALVIVTLPPVEVRLAHAESAPVAAIQSCPFVPASGMSETSCHVANEAVILTMI